MQERLRARYHMTHKESEEFGKHNDDVEIIVEKTGVWPCEREKKGQKGKRYVGTRMLVTVGNSVNLCDTNTTINKRSKMVA